jgi:hypothetical protein
LTILWKFESYLLAKKTEQELSFVQN